MPQIQFFWCKPMKFQTSIIWSYNVHSLKYLRVTKMGCKDMRNRKSEFVTKTQFLCRISGAQWNKHYNTENIAQVIHLGINTIRDFCCQSKLSSLMWQDKEIYLFFDKHFHFIKVFKDWIFLFFSSFLIIRTIYSSKRTGFVLLSDPLL